MNPFSKQELDEIRVAVNDGHHNDFVVRLVATIDALEKKVDDACEERDHEWSDALHDVYPEIVPPHDPSEVGQWAYGMDRLRERS